MNQTHKTGGGQENFTTKKKVEWMTCHREHMSRMPPLAMSHSTFDIAIPNPGPDL